MGEFHTRQLARIVETRAVEDAEVVALARHHHVVVAVVAHLARLARGAGDDRAGHGKPVALAFLAAEPATHAADLYAHGAHGQVKRMGHFVLDFSRVLRR